MERGPWSSPRKPLFVALCTDPYLRFKRGTKWVEIRRARGPWNPRQVYPGRPLTLSHGYKTEGRLPRQVGRVAWGRPHELPRWAIEGADLDHPVHASPYWEENEPVVAFACLADGGNVGKEVTQ